MSGPDRPATPRSGGEIPCRPRVAPQPDRRSARLRRTKRAQPLVSTLVREDTPAVPSRPTGDRLVPLGLQIARLSSRLDLIPGRSIGDIVGSLLDETGGEKPSGRHRSNG